MKPSTELFDLIKSLNGSEKRYFKLSASMQKGNKNYLKLFDAIDSQKIYDEESIKKKLKNEKFVRRLAFTKNYLYKLIFKTLISFHSEKSIDAKLNNILNRCRFMFEKALFDQYFKTVRYGKELAQKYERFRYLLEFIEIDSQLTKKEELGKKNINEVYNEELEVLEKIKNVNNYKRTVSNLFRIYRLEGIARNSFVENRIDEIFCSDEFKNEKKALSIVAGESYYFALTIANEIKGNFREAYFFNKKRFELISNNKEIFQNSLLDNHRESFLSLIPSALNSGKYIEAEKLFERYKKIFRNPEIDNIDISTIFYNMRLTYLISKEKKDASDTLSISLEKFLLKYKGKVNIDTYTQFFYDLARYYFVTENFEESLRIINILFVSKNLRHVPYLEPYSRVLNIMIHYELGNYKLLQYLIPATIKYLKSKNKFYRFEKTILNFIKKLSKAGRDQNIYNELISFRNEVKLLSKDKYEKNAFRFIEIEKWINKKLKYSK